MVAARPLAPATIGVLLLGAMVAGCTPTYKAPKQPVVSISELQISEDRRSVDLELIVRNDYEADYVVDGGTLTIAVDAWPLVEIQPRGNVPIASYGIEVFELENQLVRDEQAVARLLETEAGLRDRISYHVFGTLVVDGDGRLKVDQRGQLHPTPGKAGHFRGPTGVNRGDRRLKRRI